MTDRHRDYILKHWNEYDLTDTYDEFIALINILESYGETIDSLHAVALNGYKEFCGIFGSFDTDRETVKALHEFNAFLATPEEVASVIYDRIEDYRWDGCTQEYIDTEIKSTFCDDENADDMIIRTHDGYVWQVRY